jgi:hypothetical protein
VFRKGIEPSEARGPKIDFADKARSDVEEWIAEGKSTAKPGGSNA